eukprot:7659188-Lingulodinium_polyedra.AAC.1
MARRRGRASAVGRAGNPRPAFFAAIPRLAVRRQGEMGAGVVITYVEVCAQLGWPVLVRFLEVAGTLNSTRSQPRVESVQFIGATVTLAPA